MKLEAGIALLAIDPSSEQTGGAVLADRFRWNDLPPDVFVRSLASRGSLAGVSTATDACIRVLEAAGYGLILIETVGVGQTGFEIRHLADTVVVLLSPESGDALQLLKAGLIETGDIFVVNKADRPGADALLTDLRSALETDNGEQPKLVLAVSALNGDGITELAEAIAQRRQSGGSIQNRAIDYKRVLMGAANQRFAEKLEAALKDRPELIEHLQGSAITIEAAVDILLGGLDLS